MWKDTDFGDINLDILTLVWYIVYIWYAFGIYRVRLYVFWCIRFYWCEFWYVGFSDMYFGIWKILTSVIYIGKFLWIYEFWCMNSYIDSNDMNFYILTLVRRDGWTSPWTDCPEFCPELGLLYYLGIRNNVAGYTVQSS